MLGIVSCRECGVTLRLGLVGWALVLFGVIPSLVFVYYFYAEASGRLYRIGSFLAALAGLPLMYLGTHSGLRKADPAIPKPTTTYSRMRSMLLLLAIGLSFWGILIGAIFIFG